MTDRRAWVVDPFDWRVDPEAPAVPTDDPAEVDVWRALMADAPKHPSAHLTQRLRMRSLLAEHELAGKIAATRSMLDLVRAVREVCLDAPGEPAAPPPAPRHAGGRPTDWVRNDRLLALYEALPERLHKSRRCVLVAKAYAHETGTRELSAPAVRDAVAKARVRRDNRA